MLHKHVPKQVTLKMFSKLHKGPEVIMLTFTTTLIWKYVGKRTRQFHHRKRVTGSIYV